VRITRGCGNSASISPTKSSSTGKTKSSAVNDIAGADSKPDSAISVARRLGSSKV
jgi:hypothetical protein